MTPVTVTVPPESVLSPMPPFTAVGARRATSPVGVPEDVEVTVTFAVTAVPWVMLTVAPPLRVRLVVVLWKAPTASGHWVARLVTFTEPSPVAKSYPVPVVHAGVVVEAVLTRTPLVPAVLLLQFVEFPVHGTELFPLVMSLNAHAEPERISVEEL